MKNHTVFKIDLIFWLINFSSYLLYLQNGLLYPKNIFFHAKSSPKLFALNQQNSIIINSIHRLLQKVSTELQSHFVSVITHSFHSALQPQGTIIILTTTIIIIANQTLEFFLHFLLTSLKLYVRPAVRPEPPRNVRVFNATISSLTAKWDPAPGPGPVQSYKITYQPASGGEPLTVSLLCRTCLVTPC